MIQLAKPVINEEATKLVNEVIVSGQVAQGPMVERLEEAFRSYCGTRYAVAVNSGTAALHCALHALGLSKGDEVITSPFTFIATANAVLTQGARLRFADIEEETFGISIDAVQAEINKSTKVILPVSLYGLPYNQKINDIAKDHDLLVVDDASQAIGASVAGVRTGSLADVTTFSLYATKNIISGEGGIITTDDLAVAKKCRRFRHHGFDQRTKTYEELGYNYRMSDLHAALGVGQMMILEELTQKRINNAHRLSEGLDGVSGIVLPKHSSENRHVYHQYTIRVTQAHRLGRDKLQQYLLKNGVQSGVYYAKPLHLYGHFKMQGSAQGLFPNAERAANEVLSLPVHPFVSESEIETITKLIRDGSK